MTTTATENPVPAPTRRFAAVCPPHRTTDAAYAEWVANVVGTFDGDPTPWTDTAGQREWRDEAARWAAWLAHQSRMVTVPFGHEPSTACWCRPEVDQNGPHTMTVIHRLDAVEPFVWDVQGDLHCLRCADPGCPAYVATINISPDVNPLAHAGATPSALRRRTEHYLRATPGRRYCELHANQRDTTLPWHRVRLHFPSTQLCAAHWVEDSIRGRDRHHAAYMAGLNWPGADHLRYLDCLGFDPGAGR